MKEIPGGSALVDWLRLSRVGLHGFADDEIVKLVLDRQGGSCLELRSRLVSNDIWQEATIRFEIANMIDVSMEGFSHQNVIGGLRICRANQPDIHPSLLGIGASVADHEIIIEPCAGAFGTIRGTITSITVTR